jgi:hypothetical protein
VDDTGRPSIRAISDRVSTGVLVEKQSRMAKARCVLVGAVPGVTKASSILRFRYPFSRNFTSGWKA